MTAPVFTQSALDAAAALGASAGQSFLDTGIWPRCPFRKPDVAPLAKAWRRQVFAVVGPALQPKN